MSDDTDDEDRCRVITEVAIEKAMDKCGSEEAVRRQLMRIVGMDDSALDPDCDAALEEGLTVETLASTRATRQWVLCRSWTLVQEDDETLSGAVSRAWSEAQKAGEDEGFEV
jgi:hypothetical protein